MASPTIPFPRVFRAAAAYHAGLRFGLPQPDGTPKRTSIWYTSIALSQGNGNTRRLLDIAAALGVELPGYPTPADETIAARYRIDSSEYRAWKSAPRLPTTDEMDDAHAAFLRAQTLSGEIAAPPLPDAAKPAPGFAVVRNSAQYDANGDIKAQWVGTKRAPGDAYEVPQGHLIKGESALTDPDGRTIVRWVKTAQGPADGALIPALREAFAEWTGRAPPLLPVEEADRNLLTIYPIADLHLGLYAWGAETGDDYDLKIAVDNALRSMAALVAQSRPSKRAILLGLGDYFHANDSKALTPKSGNRLDVDGRWQKVVRAGADLALGMIALVAAKHQQVDVVMLPGNHDVDAAPGLTVALSLYYAGQPSIRVWEKPAKCWFERFGKCLFGATHGDTMKPAQMAMVLAEDRPEDWGRTTHRHFFFGHIHHESAKEIGSVRCESFSSPAGKDAYASAAGYRSSRAFSAITYHALDGEIGRHRVRVFGRPRIAVRAGSAAA
jgi:hypothetical protein